MDCLSVAFMGALFYYFATTQIALCLLGQSLHFLLALLWIIAILSFFQNELLESPFTETNFFARSDIESKASLIIGDIQWKAVSMQFFHCF